MFFIFSILHLSLHYLLFIYIYKSAILHSL
nr:MAG TPA: hypothetical protein [Caudoviricetes sp.]